MPINGILRFQTIEELQLVLEQRFNDLKKKTEDYSKIIGEKLRAEEASNDTDVAELREKLTNTSDSKKRKPVKKEKNTQWHNLGSLSIFNGIGAKGELELYFKALEELKLRIENLQKVKDAINDIRSKGLKNDLGCVAFLSTYSSALELVFTKARETKNKFSYKSIFSVDMEPVNLIEIH